MNLKVSKTVLVRAGIILAGYVGLYLLNAVYGGYVPYYASDGRRRYDRTLLVHDCILWQPRFGTYYNAHRRDAIGLLFYPLRGSISGSSTERIASPTPTLPTGAEIGLTRRFILPTAARIEAGRLKQPKRSCSYQKSSSWPSDVVARPPRRLANACCS